MSDKLLKDMQNSIMQSLQEDTRPMTFNFLMHKAFRKMQILHPSLYIEQKFFSDALSELMKKYWVGRNKYNKYFIDYLDFEETDISGEGFLELDSLSGNGYITIKRNFREYKKPSYFVHRKNLLGAKHGDYVKFQELNNTKSNVDKFAFKDATIKEILPRPVVE